MVDETKPSYGSLRQCIACFADTNRFIHDNICRGHQFLFLSKHHISKLWYTKIDFDYQFHLSIKKKSTVQELLISKTKSWIDSASVSLKFWLYKWCSIQCTYYAWTNADLVPIEVLPSKIGWKKRTIGKSLLCKSLYTSIQESKWAMLPNHKSTLDKRKK